MSPPCARRSRSSSSRRTSGPAAGRAGVRRLRGRGRRRGHGLDGRDRGRRAPRESARRVDRLGRLRRIAQPGARGGAARLGPRPGRGRARSACAQGRDPRASLDRDDPADLGLPDAAPVTFSRPADPPRHLVPRLQAAPRTQVARPPGRGRAGARGDGRRRGRRKARDAARPSPVPRPLGRAPKGVDVRAARRGGPLRPRGARERAGTLSPAARRVLPRSSFSGRGSWTVSSGSTLRSCMRRRIFCAPLSCSRSSGARDRIGRQRAIEGGTMNIGTCRVLYGAAAVALASALTLSGCGKKESLPREGRRRGGQGHREGAGTQPPKPRSP